ncbi:MAG: hypothetical protein ACRCUJ_06615 [Phocaeicola sp.]
MENPNYAIVLNSISLSQTKAAEIVGGKRRLFRLIGEGKIRAEKKNPSLQSSPWHCNGLDVAKYYKHNSE